MSSEVKRDAYPSTESEVNASWKLAAVEGTGEVKGFPNNLHPSVHHSILLESPSERSILAFKNKVFASTVLQNLDISEMKGTKLNDPRKNNGEKISKPSLV